MLKRDKKGFTLVELLVVVVILGILVLLAMPKFMGYVSSAKEAQIKADIRTVQNDIAAKLQNDEDFISKWLDSDETKLRESLSENKVYSKKGLIAELESVDKMKDVDMKDIGAKSNLTGTFISDENGIVYYVADEIVGSNENNTSEPEVPAEPELPALTGTDLDYEFVPDKGKYAYESARYGTKGYYHYIGSDDVVTVPSVIHGETMTNYYQMFKGTTTVKKVISNDPNVTSANSMFNSAKSPSLDISDIKLANLTSVEGFFEYAEIPEIRINGFDTSNVTNMTRFFRKSKLDVVDLNNLNVSNVESMWGMFSFATMKSSDFTSWNTSKVKSAYEMFYKTNTEVLDLSSFDMSNVERINVRPSQKLFPDGQIGIESISGAGMFQATTAKTIILGPKFNTHKVKDFTAMFQDTANLTTLQGLEYLDFSSGDNFVSMFSNTNLKTVTFPASFANVVNMTISESVPVPFNQFAMNSAITIVLPSTGVKNFIIANDQIKQPVADRQYNYVVK